MHSFSYILCFCPQVFIEDNVLPPARLPVKKCPLRNLNIEHFLKTERLSAKLHPVAIISFRFAAFILNRKRQPCSITLPMELHNISLADKPKYERAERNTVFNADFSSRFSICSIYLFMHNPAFGSKEIFIPDLFKVY